MTPLLLLVSYLLGTFPTGRLVGRWHGVRVTEHGSGNVGATNVARVVGKRAGLVTFAGDVGKGLVAVLTARALGTPDDDPPVASLAAFAVVAGHCFSVPGVLVGGKGVATALGAFTGLSPALGATLLAVFAAAFTASRVVSLSSVAAAAAAPAAGYFLGVPGVGAVTAAAALVVARHQGNIRRLLAGTEPKFR